MEWESMEEIIDGHRREIEAGTPFETYIFDHETLERKYVRAVISRSSGKLPGSEKLWMVNFQGKMEPEPWAIKILEELPPEWMR